MKPRLFFFHSNGFPARTYGHFLKTLETWNPEAINILGADLSSLGGVQEKLKQLLKDIKMQEVVIKMINILLILCIDGQNKIGELNQD